MKKILFILFILFLLIPFNVYCLEYPEINSKNAIIYNLKEDIVLYEKESDKQVSIASLTKIATTITAIEKITNLDEEIIITKEILNTVRWDASVAGLKAGDKLTYKDLLYASILPSGADATNALAISLSGSINNFVEEMNLLTQRLDMKETHFINVTGLDVEGHYSTATDIVKLLKYSLQNPIFKEVFTTKEYTLSNGLKVKTTIGTYRKNTNMDTSKIIGSKTGFTLGAGLCLASLINDEQNDILVITLGAERINGVPYNIIDNMKLINFIEENYNYYELLIKDTIVKTLPVEYSKIDTYKIKTNKTITKYLPSDYDKKDFTYEYKGLNKLSYKNNKNEKLGTIKYYYKDTLLLEEDITLNKKIEISIKKILNKYKYVIIITLLTIILFIVIIFIIIKNKRKGEI